MFDRVSSEYVLENAHIRSVLADYVERKFNRELSHPVYPKLDLFHQYFCADQHEQAVHAPEAETTKEAYDPFIAETIEQFECLCRAGYEIELWPHSDPAQPYKYSWQMISDVVCNRHLYVFKTGEMEDGHPLAQQSVRPGWNHNDVFRAVHDLAAHAWGYFGFAARGEDAAFQAHANIYTAKALLALAAETRMQSAWVLFGSHMRRKDGSVPRQGDPDYIPLRQRRFPKQKAFAAPKMCCRFAKHALHRSSNALVASRNNVRLANCA